MQVQPLLTTFHCVPYFMRFKEVEDEPKHCLSPPPSNNFQKVFAFSFQGSLFPFLLFRLKHFTCHHFAPCPFQGSERNIFTIFFSSRGNANLISESFSKYISRREKCPPPKKSNKIQRNPMIVLSGRAYALSYACEETTLHAITSLCIFPTKTILHFQSLVSVNGISSE